jgi:four helix bundle protein
VGDEVRCQLLLSVDMGYLDKETWTNLDREVQEVSKMLTRLVGRVAESGERRAEG